MFAFIQAVALRSIVRRCVCAPTAPRSYLCMAITYSKSNDHPGEVANPARGQLNKENIFSLSSFAP